MIAGTVLDGRYRIVRQLGAGGMGEVYLAEHVNLGRYDALKVLQPELATDDGFVARFRHEARATNRVQHPNIVGVYDFGQLPDGRFFLSMEYADGERLDGLLRRVGALPVPRALHILAQLAEAVDHAHARGVVHRDLKPENLMLVEHRGRPDVLKVLDFGIAKILDPEGHDPFTTVPGRQILGTPPYMAPEQAGKNTRDPRIDIYAAGCIAFELVVGETVFAGGPVAQMAQHLTEAPGPPSARRPEARVPPEYDAVVMRCLEKQPDRRFPTGRDLLAALERVPGFGAHTSSAKRRYLQSLGSVSVDFDAGGSTAVTHAAAPTGAVAVPDDPEGAAEERRRALHGVFREILGLLLDQGHTHAILVVGVAGLTELSDDLARCDGEMEKLDRANQDLEGSARERESSLRFALGELAFERSRARGRGEAIPPELDVRIGEIEQRVARQREALERDLRANTDKLIGLVAERAAVEEKLDVLYASLTGAVEETAARARDTPALRDLLETMRRLRGIEAPA